MFNSYNNSKTICNILTSKNNHLCPVGSVISFAGTIAPNGWLLCNGEIVSRNTYSMLFETIGTTYGAGDGTTTFTLPDMRGRVSVAAGTGIGLTNRVLGVVGGEENHLLTINEIPSHTHSYIKQDGVQNIDAPSGTGITAADEPTTNVNSDATGGGAAHNVMQPYIVLNHIIKF
jgi:microcystin-dependent protein